MAAAMNHSRAFLQAAKDGDAGVLRELLDAGGAELLEFRGAGTPDGVSGNTAAHWAAARGHTGALEVLLAAGAPIGATNHGGGTALQSAVLNGQAEAVRLLRRHGADAEAPDEFGDSALDLAQVTVCGRGDSVWQPSCALAGACASGLRERLGSARWPPAAVLRGHGAKARLERTSTQGRLQTPALPP
jgi:hypothetical protein